MTFGTMLALFAFGSMGMNSETNIVSTQTVSAINSATPNFYSQKLFNELNNFRNANCNKDFAEFQDLHRFTEILVKNLSSVNEAGPSEDWQSATVNEYLKKSRISFRQGELNRGIVAVLLFNIASDFMNLTYRDFSEKSSFIDIPRFHFLSVPAAALKSLGLNLARNQLEFGCTDKISIEELFHAGLELASANQTRIRQKVFYSLQPN